MSRKSAPQQKTYHALQLQSTGVGRVSIQVDRPKLLGFFFCSLAAKVQRVDVILQSESAPFVFDFQSLLKALSDKEAEAHSDVDAFMEHCAKRWQTREGTYQLKRRRLKPDFS